MMKMWNAVLGLALTTAVINAAAQKSYTEGAVNLSTSIQGMEVQAKQYFKPDSSAVVMAMGPANVKMLTDAGHKFFAVVIDVPAASIKKAGIATPDELDQATAAMPVFTFSPTSDSKQISGFKCKKVVAKDNKSGKAYDVWITNDVSLPPTAYLPYYINAGGFPVQYTEFQQGQEVAVTVTAVNGEKAPKGTFGIAPDFDKVSLEELRQMNGRAQ